MAFRLLAARAIFKEKYSVKYLIRILLLKPDCIL